MRKEDCIVSWLLILIAFEYLFVPNAYAYLISMVFGVGAFLWFLFFIDVSYR